VTRSEKNWRAVSKTRSGPTDSVCKTPIGSGTQNQPYPDAKFESFTYGTV